MGQIVKRFLWSDTGTNDSSYNYTRYSNAREEGRGSIATSGSSTTVTATAITTGIGTYNPFDGVNVGDILVIRYGLGDGAESVRKVTAKASGLQLTVDSAITLTNGTGAWGYFQKKKGTATTDGIHTVDFKKKSFILNVTTLGSTSLDFQLEGRSGSHSDNGWTPIWTQNITATGSVYFPIQEPWDLLRLGEKANTPGTDVFSAYLLCEEN
jgi:hypothetical protein